MGASKTQYNVYRDLLARESPYFRAMLSGAWKESSRQPVPVPLANNAMFPSFLDCLYFRRLKHPLGTVGGTSWSDLDDPCVNCEIVCGSVEMSKYELAVLTAEEDTKLENMIEGVSTNNQWTHLYLFADKFDVSNLRQDIIDHYYESCWVSMDYDRCCHPSYKEIILAFRHLPASSPLCRLMIDTYAVTWTADGDAACLSEANMRSKLPVAFSYPVMEQIRLKSDGDGTRKGVDGLCTFHEHGGDVQKIIACKKWRDGREDRNMELTCSCMDVE